MRKPKEEPAVTTYSRDDIKQLLNAKPFRPFKLRLSNGRIFNVRAHDDLWVGLSGSLVFDSGRNDFGLSDLECIKALEMRRTTKAAR
jgi:hypothetical protein